MVWGNTNAFKLNSIITLQKWAVRILSNADYLAHTSELFLNHKILKLDQINILQTAIFMFKLLNDEVSTCFNTMFMTNNKTHKYNTRLGNNLRTPKHNANIVRNTLKFMDTKVWNEIPTEIGNSRENCLLSVHGGNLPLLKLCGVAHHSPWWGMVSPAVCAWGLPWGGQHTMPPAGQSRHSSSLPTHS